MKYDQKTIDAAVEWVENNISYAVADELHDSLMGNEERNKKIRTTDIMTEILSFLKKKKKPQSHYDIVRYVMKTFGNVRPRAGNWVRESVETALDELKRQGKIKAFPVLNGNITLWGLA